MPPVTSHPSGSFCWIELATTDLASARAFYTGLFGWDVHEMPMSETEVYTIFRKGGLDVAAMHGHTAGGPPNWMSYIAVDDVDDFVLKAKGRGGNVLAPPMDVFGAGRMAVLVDDQSAVFAVWQAMQHIGVQLRDEPDSLCWNELQARDVEAGKRFYPPLFGWRMKESYEYTEWHLGENAVGGMLPTKAPPEAPAFWLPYFAVEDCDAAAAKAQSFGGIVHVPPMDIEHVGRFSVLMDGQGAAFAVIKLTL
ncbi:MAG TPA: VOC family protein [Thermoanaerobaculia bacterium]|nr:VOC family protein [Thermoanaerobaculia bacterium]